MALNPVMPGRSLAFRLHRRADIVPETLVGWNRGRLQGEERRPRLHWHACAAVEMHPTGRIITMLFDFELQSLLKEA
ncbi:MULTISPECIES: hypothetical protein [Rhizobium]|uniref:hypothetical protein n=1 Tax=Rhizobium TaxID=379 RepID=UPI001B323820|nr:MULTISPECIES: hypothetical protein [Rhizobium]MBX4910671.1 hypothetical protein [Rhizobium bangladeshense]MBX5218239.1 hypothetical protein [Rhizobium sp. NLR9a]MBX5235963.1 hypothetical protein [Rhizobium sp. NLR4a]MBX5241610.1 hypothetical protein [Rhizobium sp. NLR22b]MBX5248276.1 hypothetical protein [Rhizobium sp. NLR3b]